MMVARKSKEDMRRYAGWARRTGKMYRSVDTGGRPVPESAIKHMQSKPYGIGSANREENENDDSEKTT